MHEVNLRIPGPVPLPDNIRAAIAAPVINHRGDSFAELFERMSHNMRTCLKTKSDVYFITSSGTGVMEMAVANTISQGDKVLCVSIGWFGDRFADIALAYGADVEKMRYDAGVAADADEVRAKLRELKNVKAVLITHNESSTGVCNPLKELCQVVRAESDALILVDAVSSAGGIELETDEWGIDVVTTAAQKAWIAPAGISVIAFSKKAWQAYEQSKVPKYYFDIGHYRQYGERKQTPFTPCVTAMFGLACTLERLGSGDIDNFIAAHSDVADKVRAGVRSMGLEILPHDVKYASNTVTAVKLPTDIDGVGFLRRALDEHRVEFGDGPGDLKGKVFRIGHLGWLDAKQIDGALEVASMLLSEMRG